MMSQASTACSGENTRRHCPVKNFTESNVEYRYGERRNTILSIPVQMALPRRKQLGNLPGWRRNDGLRSSGELQKLRWHRHLVKRSVGESWPPRKCPLMRSRIFNEEKRAICRDGKWPDFDQNSTVDRQGKNLSTNISALARYDGLMTGNMGDTENQRNVIKCA